MNAKLADIIENALPQTQCTKCGFNGCKPYAQAIANGDANYNQCPPGGQKGVEILASILNKPIISLNTEHGAERVRHVAVIDPNICIGCTLCIQACPVDAIVGAAKHMHNVVPSLCTGCDLCVEPCPVDCITMHAVTTETGWNAWSKEQANDARKRYEQRNLRLEKIKTALNKPKQQVSQSLVQPNNNLENPVLDKKAIIAAAMERAKQRLLENQEDK